MDLLDPVDIDGNQISIGKLLLSPTRTYMPILVPILREYRQAIHGMIHNTGGAHSKVLKFVNEGVRITKNNLFEPPPIFSLIKKESGVEDEELYKVLNMGCRLEIYVDPDYADQIMDVIGAFNVDVQVIGEVSRGEKQVDMTLPNGSSFSYK